MRPYLIETHPWKRTSAGGKALHLLAEHLAYKGIEVYTSGPTHMRGVTQATPEQVAMVAADGIVVYPEVEAGNKHKARRVARLLLNIPGHIRGDKEFPRSELLFAHNRILSRYLRDVDNILTVPVTNTLDFDQPDENERYTRRGALVWRGMGKPKRPTEFIVDAEMAREITLEWPRTQGVLADLFRRADIFYTYQNFTNLTIEARLCGCPTVIIPNGLYSKAEFEAARPGVAGLAWGNSDAEIEHARATVGQFRAAFYKMHNEFGIQLERFIEKTQGMA